MMDNRRTKKYSRDGEHATVVVEAEESYLSDAQDFQVKLATNRAMIEATANFDELKALVSRFRRGSFRHDFEGELNEVSAKLDSDELIMSGHQVMQAWERELMHRMVRLMLEEQRVLPGETAGLNVLEVGFGMGISATEIMRHSPASYTVLEPNPDVVESWDKWKNGRENVRLIQGYWQDVISDLGEFDAIFYDPYVYFDEGREYEPMIEFFPVAAEHLKPGGSLVYFTCEIDSIGRPHQRELFKYFRRFSSEVVEGLVPPEGCQYWWSDRMAIVSALK